MTRLRAVDAAVLIMVKGGARHHDSPGFDNIGAPETQGYGVDHVRAVEALGCRAVRVADPAELESALRQAQVTARELRVPVVVEVILEKVTDISMGAAGLDSIARFEALALTPEDAPTATALIEA